MTFTQGGGSATTAVTDAAGVFEVYDLPRATYQVSIDVPKRYKAAFGFVSGPRKFSDGFPLTVTLGDSHATAVFYVKSADAKQVGVPAATSPLVERFGDDSLRQDLD